MHCYRPNGAPVDAQFSVAYSQDRLLGGSRTLGAYLFAHRPTTSSSFSRAEYYFNPLDWSTGQIRRIGRGRYEVDLFQLGGAYSKSTALVTAESAVSDHCKVRRWQRRGSLVQVSVDCYDAGGAPKDTKFFLSFLTERTF